ncbi:riboflavin synthase [Corynebacterium uberis]|uniref:riboflavin synthase n=1 Tax=Corynebacterium TaxID=1716 RepID=UPI001D0A1693|nr:riboflavin synthase [Corynebacterium uberis]MCZ9308590.1 riboflavin synthase [Corynebacterium sp. c6VSa_13]UDL74238.1 riboflavin synthase [Corynebacterium uberis]UDL74882.1 riboflavin synthase [Corynebacterium uberis]UDL77096.1 riboflavin synthase [Corynebacterium uberis]UDL79379.1 riboflavin synthase [Corynebacterium uberis]
MFTGLVEELGRVQELTRHDDDSQILTIAARTVLSDAKLGDSLCVNGVCLTITQIAEDHFSADVMKETLQRTALGELTAGAQVNLERAMPVGGRLGGHLVQGHVDATATLLARTHSEHWDVLRLSLPEQIDRYVVEKGSITVSGTSLTVSATQPGWFEVSLIPATLEQTILGQLEVGDPVNLEVDVLAKYVEKLLGPGAEHASSGD